MKNKLTVVFLSFILILVPLGRVVSAQGQATDIKKTAEVRSEVAKRVSNKKTRVKIKLRDGKELKARINQANENGCSVTDEKTGKQIELVYSDVVAVKGRGMSTGMKIGIIAGVAAAALAIAVLVALKNFDPFENGLGNVLH